MKGCIEVGKRLHRLEAIVAAQDLAAAGLEKFGGGTPVSAPPTSPLRAKISSSKAADSALQPEASPITAARSRRHPANWNLPPILPVAALQRAEIAGPVAVSMLGVDIPLLLGALAARGWKQMTRQKMMHQRTKLKEVGAPAGRRDGGSAGMWKPS